MSRTGTTLSLLFIGLLVLAGCGGSGTAAPVPGAAPAKFPMTVQTCGREVTIERPPERVMTVGSQAATLVWAAGAANKVAALVAASRPLYRATAAFDGISKMIDEPTKEVILGLKPDLIIGYGLSTTTWEEIESLGFDQIVTSGQCDRTTDDGPTLDRTASFQDIYHDIELFGRIFSTEDIATKAVTEYRKRVAAIEERFRSAPRRTAAVVQAYPDHLAVYGQASISHVQLTTLGLTNAFAEVQDRTIELNVEQLLARDPYMLVLAHSPKVTADQAMQQLREIPGAEKLTAVREGHIIPVEGSVILGGIQPIEALDDMAAMLAGFR